MNLQQFLDHQKNKKVIESKNVVTASGKAKRKSSAQNQPSLRTSREENKRA
jgi:hypothetical protein